MIVVSDAVGGVALLLFILAHLMGGRVSRSVRRALTSGMSTDSESAEEGEDPQSGTDLMSRLAAIGDTTGKQMVNLAWLGLGVRGGGRPCTGVRGSRRRPVGWIVRGAGAPRA